MHHLAMTLKLGFIYLERVMWGLIDHYVNITISLKTFFIKSCFN